ncbi:polysaccharide deacetylase family protein [Zhaonella formicivorans]|uniref:polysaccharide deacetylase family protein n=1 Tax=Zhaonella formicivorans TaxID=2528593 RepID=UPI0010E8574B|nr:polysaccharide deacetylase family protein [Zhaonella formicivorans]
MLKKVMLMFVFILLAIAGCRSLVPDSVNLVLGTIYEPQDEISLPAPKHISAAPIKVSGNELPAPSKSTAEEQKTEPASFPDGENSQKSTVPNMAGKELQTEKNLENEMFSEKLSPPRGKNNPSGKNIYLTFDDGPDAVNTPRILAILDLYGIKATFFVVGTNVEKYPEIVQQIEAQGSLVANHTYSHKYQSVYASEEAFLKEIYKNEELLFQLIGKRPRIIREPGGRFLGKTDKQAFIAKAGYELKGWNVDSYDSRKPIPNANQIVANVKRQANNQLLWDEMVILFHDGPGHASTVEALPAIIEYFQAQGFSFKVF